MRTRSGLSIVIAVLIVIFASFVLIISVNHAPLGTPTKIELTDNKSYGELHSLQGFGTGVTTFNSKQEDRKAELFQAMKTTALSSAQLQEVESYGDQLNVNPGEVYDAEEKRVELNIALAMQIALQRTAMSDMIKQLQNPQCLKSDDLGVKHPSICNH